MWQGEDQPARARFPDASSEGTKSRQDPASIRPDGGDWVHLVRARAKVRWLGEGGDQMTRSGIPDLGHAIAAHGYRGAAVRAPRRSTQDILMAQRRCERFTRGDAPHASGLIFAGGEQ